MERLRTLPGDDVRQIMWRFADRYDLQMVVQSSRSVARTTAARLVADGARNTHDWTPEKEELLKAFDASGLTGMFMEPEQGGFIAGPKNLAMCLVAYELSWVDGGAATCNLATDLALAPIHERGTQEQKDYYMTKCVPPQPGEDREIWRGAFALTEPLPYVGVDTGVVSGKVRIAEWKDGEEPMIQVEKRGRFITNMAFANFVTAAVNSDDERIKSSCMVIMEEGDEGIYDPGAPTLKMVHQLSATNDPVFSLKVPASRIIGGYTIQDGVIVPNYSHGEIIGAVFQRTRIPVGVMSAAKLLSAVEPVIRYQRGRFRGGESKPGTPRYELGLQQNEDANQRLLDIWSTGEAMASLGFAAGRMADDFDPIEKEKDRLFIEREIKGPRAQLKALKPKDEEAIEMVQLRARPKGERDQSRLDALEADPLVQYCYLSAMSNVYIPACKLWNTGYGCQMMREAVSLMGGYGITEDCPGFLGQKWMDAQLEATYEGPEVVQRRQLSISMTGPVFSAQLTAWIDELKRRAQETPGRGHCTLAAAFELWGWTVNHLQSAKDPEGKPLMHGRRQGVTFQLADALSWLIAVKCFMDDVDELAEKGQMNPVVAEGLDALVDFYGDMATWQAARAAGETGRVAADLVFGYILHPDCAGECCGSEASGNLFDGAADFYAMRSKVDAAVAGARLAKDRAAADLTKVMIPEALDYPL